MGIKLGIDPAFGGIYVIDVIRGRWSPGEIETKVTTAAMYDGQNCLIRPPQDPGSAGKFQACFLANKLRGYSVTSEREEGSKPYLANPFAAQYEHGWIALLDAPWNDAFVEELCAFPNGAHDDQVDAVSAAFRALVRRPQWNAVAA